MKYMCWEGKVITQIVLILNVTRQSVSNVESKFRDHQIVNLIRKHGCIVSVSFRCLFCSLALMFRKSDDLFRYSFYGLTLDISNRCRRPSAYSPAVDKDTISMCPADALGRLSSVVCYRTSGVKR